METMTILQLVEYIKSNEAHKSLRYVPADQLDTFLLNRPPVQLLLVKDVSFQDSSLASKRVQSLVHYCH